MSPAPRSVLGLDLSLVRTGMASVDLERDVITTAVIKPTFRGHKRLRYIVRRISAAARTHDVIALEGPAFNARGSRQHEVSGLWWLVRHALWELEKPVCVISPAIRAKYTTGHGNAPKKYAWSGAVEKWPHVPLKTDDEADALILAAIGARVAGRPFDSMPDKSSWSPVNGLKFEMDSAVKS